MRNKTWFPWAPIWAIGLLAGLLLLPVPAAAQSANSIAGVVNDSSGGALPGVTVEAASPALIEKVRTAVTDGQGRYNITDLRPGTYSVTFALPGFNTTRREGIVLTGGFTATVNVDLAVGALAETITVTGATPLVDTSNSRQMRVVQTELLDTLPSGHNTNGTILAFTPGLRNSAGNGATAVGGTDGAYRDQQGVNASIHGKIGAGKLLFDGMHIANMHGTGGTSQMLPMKMAVETTVETGGANAESFVSGVTMNAIPKDGGNVVSFTSSALYSNGNLVSNNSTGVVSALKPAGVLITQVYDASAYTGGPIKRDRLWYYGGFWRSGNKNLGNFMNKVQHSHLYVPDTSNPSKQFEWYTSAAGRVTWQASKKHKLAFLMDAQWNCQCRQESDRAPEAQQYTRFLWPKQGLYMASYSAPLSNRILVEAAVSEVRSHFEIKLTPQVQPGDVRIIEQSTGQMYESQGFVPPITPSDRFPNRFALSYVTGTHAVKTGLYYAHGTALRPNKYETGDVSYLFNNQKPAFIEQWVSPWSTLDKLKAELGVFLQDQWQMKRVTLNYGLRFDYFNAYSPAQSLPDRRFVPAQSFAKVSKIPEWFDLNPRTGAAFDLFGDGRTALKVAFGRYLGNEVTAVVNANDPITSSVVSANRTWTDNGDLVPQCDLTNFNANGECGPILNSNFGKANPAAAKWDPSTLRGWGVRPYLWDFSAEIQHELTRGISVNGGYYRNWWSNFRVNDNLLIGPADFTPFCITAPSDPRLPKGGGYQVCGNYDISVEKRTLNQTLTTQAAPFGKQTQVSDFFAATTNIRLSNGVRFGGGVDWGRTVAETCFTVDSPAQEKTTVDGKPYCHAVTPWLANLQAKFFGSYAFPKGLTLAATLQNTGGLPITASYAAPNSIIAPSLGRPLAACPATGTCNASLTVPLVLQGDLFSRRRTQLDTRVTKAFRMQKYRATLYVDAYNLLNANAPQAISSVYGPLWQNITTVMSGRQIMFGAGLDF